MRNEFFRAARMRHTPHIHCRRAQIFDGGRLRGDVPFDGEFFPEKVAAKCGETIGNPPEMAKRKRSKDSTAEKRLNCKGHKADTPECMSVFRVTWNGRIWLKVCSEMFSGF